MVKLLNSKLSLSFCLCDVYDYEKDVGSGSNKITLSGNSCLAVNNDSLIDSFKKLPVKNIFLNYSMHYNAYQEVEENSAEIFNAICVQLRQLWFVHFQSHIVLHGHKQRSERSWELKHKPHNEDHRNARHNICMVLYNKLVAKYWRTLLARTSSHTHVAGKNLQRPQKHYNLSYTNTQLWRHRFTWLSLVKMALRKVFDVSKPRFRAFHPIMIAMAEVSQISLCFCKTFVNITRIQLCTLIMLAMI